jgi:hypothetical protein
VRRHLRHAIPFPFHHLPSYLSPSTPPSPTHLVRSHLFLPCPLQSLIIHTAKKKETYTLKKVVKTWRVPVDVSTVAAVRGVSVLLPSLCRRRVLVCRRMYLLPPSPPPFPVVFHGAVLTGTATFFFIHCLYIDRAQSKSLSHHVVCIVTECAAVVGHQAANCPKAGTPTW